MHSHIFEKAKDFGFDLVGITPAKIPEKDKENIKEWVANGLFGAMDWFERFQNVRLNLENLGFQAQSAIVLGLMYRTPEGISFTQDLGFSLSEYALGHDYHKVLKEKAKPLLKYLRDSYPDQKFRQGVDTLPVPEKVLGRMAGLGWIGKNTNLISPEKGSFFFLSVILTTLELPRKEEIHDRCGSCTKCIDACPTNALFEAYKIDAGKCISHQNIENRSPRLEESLHGWAYGCDICQTVCPWNEKAIRWERFSRTQEFLPLESLKNKKSKLSNLSMEDWKAWTKESAVNRISYEQWLRNLNSL
jgi:epoxyqueuosine reductase